MLHKVTHTCSNKRQTIGFHQEQNIKYHVLFRTPTVTLHSPQCTQALSLSLSFSWMIALIPWNRSGSSTNNSLRVHRITLLLPCSSPLFAAKVFKQTLEKDSSVKDFKPREVQGGGVVFKSHIWYGAKTDSSAIMWLMVYRLCVCMRFSMCVCTCRSMFVCCWPPSSGKTGAVATRFAPAGWRLSECKQNSV